MKERIASAFVVFSLNFLMLLPAWLLAEVESCQNTQSESCKTEPARNATPALSSSEHSEDLGQSQTERAALFRKRILVQQLSDTRRSLEKRFAIRINTSAVENFCLEAETSLLECEQEVNAVEERLVKRAELEKALEKPQAQEQKPQESNPGNVIIIQNDTSPIWIVKPRRPHPHYPYYHKRPDHHHSDRPVSARPSTTPQPPSVSTPGDNPFRPKSGFSESLRGK